ncbi:SEC-C metal-binding domain-containing protein [Actinoplanes aureus]|uniref:SEC-C domain-containing protein n=1 Tax=Actinoplanes aureus TaxID=2792083 RepID=A0A931CBE2_9ACTN|nr:SEC-C metal-binding domain-containing protein [Actinoplanes aureus]MBG0563013.1 SEC-C domain-containing protein [Actinoplanes aureus]
MPSNELLTSDDLDAIGHDAFRAEDPRACVAELVEAVEGERLADPTDAGYAYSLAAEIIERQGDLAAALELVSRAVAAYPSDEGGFARAYRGDLLARLGHEDEAMTEFAALRPRLVRDPDAASYLSEAMEECGFAPIAEQWLTAALESVLDRPGDGPDDLNLKLLYHLIQARSRIRRELELPVDEHDEMADRMREAAYGVEPDVDETTGQGLLFWPKAEFDRVLLRWPALADAYGRTWDEHRARLEKELAGRGASGETGLVLFAGLADGLAAFATRMGGDPAEAAIQLGYEDQQLSGSAWAAWPPGRNGPCWCGSGGKYKKCCLPRSRA